MNAKKTGVLLSTSAIMLAAGSLAPLTAYAAEARPAAATDDGSITVTARKRSEDILKVPVTVSALTAADLEARGAQTITDVVAATPGINVNNNSSGHADRSFQQVILRGFTPATTLASTTSMFIDGVPVSSPSQLTAVSDPAQVEVLKGPQSAYFGRNTFAGAINVSNKTPSGDWGGEADVMFGNRASRSFKGVVEGGFFDKMLTFRLTASSWTKDGSYRNVDGTTLGDQASHSYTAYVVAKPTDKLTIKLFGMLGADEDGPSAQTRLIGYNLLTPSGAVAYPSQSNCTVNGNPWFCGTLPNSLLGVSSDTIVSPQMHSQLTGSRTMLKLSDQVQHYGLLRHSQHAHGVVDYTFSPHISAQLLGGYNHETWSNLIDLDGLNSTPTAFNWPYIVESKNRDWSSEARINYTYSKLHGVLGASYLSAQSQQALGSVTGSPYSVGGISTTKTFGAFFGATYDFTAKLSASAEGRYQIDTIAAFGGSSTNITSDGSASYYLPAGRYGPGSLLGQQSFNNFTPRIIVNYQFTPALMVYASWAKGVNPSTFNSSIITQNTTVQAAGKAANVPLFARPEKVTNYEIGIKGKLLDGRLRYSAAAYYAQWKDQVNVQSIVYYVNGVVQTNSGYTNTGNVDMYGLEANTTFKANDYVTIEAAGAYNQSRIISYYNSYLTSLYGTSNFHNKEMPMTSKYSANVGITVGDNIKGTSDGKWFLRGDWNFKSGVWTDAANVARTRDLHLFNARLGASVGRYSASVFVNNIFNNHTPVSANDQYTYASFTGYFANYSSIQLGLPDLRTFGVQLKVKI